MAPAAIFKSIVRIPDLVVPGRRQTETRPAPGEGDTVWARWRFSDDPHTMSTAKDGVELQPHGSKHMTLGYCRVSAWLTQGKTAVEVKQGSLNLASAAYLPGKDRLRGEKEKNESKQQKASENYLLWSGVQFQTRRNRIFKIIRGAVHWTLVLKEI